MTLRGKLVDIALEWQESFGVAPSITSAISEYDAAMLIGMSQNEYSEYMKDKTAVSKGADFVYKNTPVRVYNPIHLHKLPLVELRIPLSPKQAICFGN